MNLLKNDWNEYFAGYSINESKIGINSTFILNDQNNCYIKDCFFQDTTKTACFMYLDAEAENKVLCEYSMFINCKSDSEGGGGIYFRSQNGEIIIHHVCGIKCICINASHTDGQFIMTWLDQQNERRSYLKDSSVTQCINDGSEVAYSHIVYFNKGNVEFERINSSFNSVRHHSGITINPTNKEEPIGKMSFSSICNNTAIDSMIVSIFADCIIDSCNILHNKQNTEDNGIIHAIEGQHSTIKNCCILDNHGYPVFKNLEDQSTPLIIINCTVDLNMECVKGHSYKDGSIEMRNMPYITTRFINELSFFSTGDCQFSYDSVNLYSPSNCIYPTIVTPYPLFNHLFSSLAFIALINEKFN